MVTRFCRWYRYLLRVGVFVNVLKMNLVGERVIVGAFGVRLGDFVRVAVAGLRVALGPSVRVMVGDAVGERVMEGVGVRDVTTVGEAILRVVVGMMITTGVLLAKRNAVAVATNAVSVTPYSTQRVAVNPVFIASRV